MEITAWFQLALVCVLGAMSPGPSLAVVVRNTVSGGRFQGVMAGLGHGIGVGLYALVAVAGLAFLLAADPVVFRAANLAGSGVLAWIGIQLWRASFRPGETVGEKRGLRGVRGFAEGFAIAFLNPKIAVFFLALFSQFVRGEAGWMEKGVMALTAGAIDTSWYVLVALVLAGSGAVNWLRRRATLVDRAIGGVLLLIAAGLFLRNL
ncbi:MAG: LysE family translocator [Rhodospirillaceae bacterium]|nr:LysE family translocator [Rhodospirillaceae bacterium]